MVIVENCVRRLAHAQEHHGAIDAVERFHEVYAASQEARRPLLFGQLIIMIVYLPIFALTGGRQDVPPDGLHRGGGAVGGDDPVGDLHPAAVALFIGKKVGENRLMHFAKTRYEPLLHRAMANKPVVLSFAGIMIVLSMLIGSRLGSEFVPSLNEGDFAIRAAHSAPVCRSRCKCSSSWNAP